MHTEACPDFRAMGYECWEVARDLCDGLRYSLFRIFGPVAMGRDAIAPAARARRISLPPHTFELGALSPI